MMLASQKLQLKTSEVRQEYNRLGQQEELQDGELETLDKLGVDLETLERRFQHAIRSEAQDTDALGIHRDARQDGEPAEKRRLYRRSGPAEYFDAAACNRALTGPEAELNAALEYRGDGRDANYGNPYNPLAQLMPLALLDPQVDRPLEYRADTDLATLENQNMHRDYLERIFNQTGGDFLGVTMNSVPVGQATWTVFTGGDSGQTRAAGVDHPAVAATMSTSTLTPKRLALHYNYRIEDGARLRGLESALREDLRNRMGVQRDYEIINGQGTLIPGFFGADFNIMANRERIDLVTATNTATVADLKTIFGNMTDGQYAPGPRDVRVLLNEDNYKALFAADADVNMFALPGQESLGFSFQQSSQIAAATAQNDPFGLVSRGRGLRNSAVCATWPALEIIRDVYTGAASGEVALIYTMLWDFAIARADNWRILAKQNS